LSQELIVLASAAHEVFETFENAFGEEVRIAVYELESE